ncbi:MAG: LPXTG cell wall anchor domain-containing protein [Clostridia bacterium]|nr:LPXTG cell wall anchor domain-containing protein [Clostridia bacterium]
MKRLMMILLCLMFLTPVLAGAEMIQVGDILIPADKAVPLTGDGAPVLLWLGLALISIAGIVELRRRMS